MVAGSLLIAALVLTGPLKQVVTVTPGNLNAGGVSVDVQRPIAVRSSEGRIEMSRHSQLQLRFRAAAGRAYRVECDFTEGAVLIMEFADDVFRDQTRSSPPDGPARHTVEPGEARRHIKLLMQPSADTEWTACRVRIL